MSVSDKTIVIGLTGAFGSGCSSVATFLADPKFELLPGLLVHTVKLSDVVREVWNAQSANEPLRSQMQDLGNELREAHGIDYLVRTACAAVEGMEAPLDALLVDGIRNTAEVAWLKQKYGFNFYLFAINVASRDRRWARSRARYETHKLGFVEFSHDDERDADEELPHGQQVQRCVDMADVVLTNNEDLDAATLPGVLGKLAAQYARLVMELDHRPANNDENLMNQAYASSNTSLCIRRQVGAVIVAPGSTDVVGVGYNENPAGEDPCIVQHGDCWKDMVRNEFFASAHKAKTRCPKCGRLLPDLSQGPPWKCKCGQSLGNFFFQDRAMNFCTAIHAEARAIINAGARSLNGYTLYTSTFPCFLCAEKIIHAGIKTVVFAEPYPDGGAAARFQKANITVRPFEGVRATAFDRVFGRYRAFMEQQVAAKKMPM